ncbi:MAG TPA: MBL fold metallo-hydrolase [Chloroflexota bacterium]|nr:MBL fold metallo-hydrolase [Chloroflexota bacterium]
MLVTPGVQVIRAANPSPMTGEGTNTYVVGEQQIIVIDPGPVLPAHVEQILSAAQRSGGRITALLVTHQHSDHLPAAYTLKQRTGAPILAHPSVPGVDRALDDGATIASELGEIAILSTPGHADDHLSFWLASQRLLFAGDLVAGVGTVVLSSSPGALSAYLASLRRLISLGPLTILPGHGPIVPNGVARVQSYLDHRAERDRQILTALAGGPRSVDEIVARVYPDLRPELRSMAGRNVSAHLEHLREAGLVERRGENWSRNNQTLS